MARRNENMLADAVSLMQRLWRNRRGHEAVGAILETLLKTTGQQINLTRFRNTTSCILMIYMQISGGLSWPIGSR